MENFIKKFPVISFGIFSTIIAVGIYLFEREISIKEADNLLLKNEIAFLNKKIKSGSYLYTWTELDAQKKIYQSKLDELNKKIEEIRRDLISARDDNLRKKEALNDLEITLYEKENLLRKIKKVLFRDKETGCSYKIRKLKKAIENSSPSDYKKLLCDIPYDSIHNIKNYLSEIKKQTEKSREEFMDALSTYDEILDTQQITKEYSNLINSYSMKRIAFVANIKTSLEDDKDRVNILTPIKQCAISYLYQSFINYEMNKEIDFIDQFVFDDFIKNTPSISYDKIFSNEKESINTINSLGGIDGLILFTGAGDGFIVELISTSNNISLHGTTKKSLLINKNRDFMLSTTHEEYIENIEDLTSRLYFDLEILDIFH